MCALISDYGAAHLTAWIPTPSLINVGHLCQTPHATFSGDRQVLGLMSSLRLVKPMTPKQKVS